MRIRRVGVVLMVVLLMMQMAAAEAAQVQPNQSVKSKMTSLCPLRIESATVLSPGELALDAGLAFEMDREWSNREYDNFRMAPLRIRYGAAPALEIGLGLGFSSNDREDTGAPDDSGLEGVSLSGKLEMNEFAALRVALTLAGDDDIAPYPNDEVDLSASLGLQRQVGKGLLYGEFGYTVQGGDFDFNEYFNYGIGYAFPASDGVSFNIELTGEESQFGSLANTLDLTLGANFVPEGNLRLAPYIVLGINDAGPDFAFGGVLEMRF